MFVEDSVLPKNTLTQAIQKASGATGVDYGYLLKTAHNESGLNPQAKSSSSSASGAFQFIEGTWLQMIKEEGSGVGLSHLAAAIEKKSYGYEVRDPALKKEILSLRHDPHTSSYMAAKLSQKNAQHLDEVLGRSPTSGELYMAHFLGASGAAKLIQSNPSAIASQLFQKEAKANPAIFNTSDGRPRTIAEVYARLTKGYENSNFAQGQELDSQQVLPLYNGLKRADAPMFHTMTVAGKPSVKMVTVYLPSFSGRNEEHAADADEAKLNNANHTYNKSNAHNFFSSLVHPSGVPQPLSQVI